MKSLDLILNVVTVVAVTIALAYFGLHFDTGLFTVVPEGVTGFFLRHQPLQYVSLAVLVVALLAKAAVGRAITRRGGRNRV
jgi:uncharacterized membrane protein